MNPTGAVARPAATVVLLRGEQSMCEVLLVQRNARLAFHGGAWVFPGGRVDPEDYAACGSEDPAHAARFAAVREAREEAGVAISTADLVPVSRWVTPEILPKRFDTWFFAAATGEDAVRIDGGEILAYRWITPEEALAAQRSGELELPPPTYVTLLSLSRYESARSALEALARAPVRSFIPRVYTFPGGACTVYGEDAAYDSGALDAPGPRHRLVMVGNDWRYECDF